MAGLYLDLYGEINNGAHRKAADLIGAPAFVWHQALWNPPLSESLKDKNDRKDIISAFVRKLHDHLNAVAEEVIPDMAEVRIGHDDRVRVITFQFVWQGMRAKIRFENHTEYVSLTSVLDASVDFSRPPLGPSKGDVALRKEVEHHLENFRTSTWRPLGADLPKIDNIQGTFDFIYKHIWDQCFFPVVLNAGNFLASTSGEHPVAGPMGQRFADFRGFISCETYPENVNEATRESKENPDLTKLGLEYQRVQRPFYKTDEDRRGRWQRDGYPNEDWARRRLDNAWPFLQLATLDKTSPLTGRTEYTVSRLQDGRIIYVSALGPQPELGFPGQPERPVYFYMHSVTQCERQIGRAIDRLVQLGTLRLAAIIALPEFKSVGQKLADISKKITYTRQLLHKLAQNAKTWEKTVRDGTEEEILSNLDLIQNEVADLSRGNPTRENKGLGEASLEYRLLRSRYYRQVFESTLESLRIKRLEGYQPYDEFVLRRLASAFRFIDGLEVRVNEVRAEWRALDQLYLITAVTVLTREIDAQQETSTKLLVNIQQTQKDVRHIQRWGELFLLMFLVPYYATELALKLFTCSQGVWCKQWIWEEYTPERKLAAILFAAFAIWGLILFFYRRTK